MGLEKNTESKFDGRVVPAFYLIDLINIMVVDNMAQIFGRIFASGAAYSAGRPHLDNFSFVFYDLRTLLTSFPSNIEADAYAWLKSLPELSGAIDKNPPPPIPPTPPSSGTPGNGASGAPRR
jgi:hypothetical protein